MPPVNPAEKLLDAPIADLAGLLLKQFTRLLHERGLVLSQVQLNQVSEAAASHQRIPALQDTLVQHLRALVEESLAYLRERFGLSFAAALQTDMSQIGGWETTAEFLDIANHKSNAELRISAAASLLALLGDDTYASELFTVVAADGGLMDVDAMIARRALCHLTQVDAAAMNWEAQVRQALDSVT